MTTLILTCDACGQKNRCPAVLTPPQSVRCGACKEWLDHPCEDEDEDDDEGDDE